MFGGPARCRSVGTSEDLQIELLVQGSDLALRGAHEQLTGHGDEDAVVVGGMVDECVVQLARH